MVIIISIYCIAIADKSGLFLMAAFFKKIRENAKANRDDGKKIRQRSLRATGEGKQETREERDGVVLMRFSNISASTKRKIHRLSPLISFGMPVELFNI